MSQQTNQLTNKQTKEANQCEMKKVNDPDKTEFNENKL